MDGCPVVTPVDQCVGLVNPIPKCYWPGKTLTFPENLLDEL